MSLEGLHERYVNFYTDFAFKKLFGTEVNKELLRSFLNSLLAGQEVITSLTYLNSEQLGTQELDRKAVFDVYCENDRGEKFLVEMQKARSSWLRCRRPSSSFSRTVACFMPHSPSANKPGAVTGTTS